MENVSPYIHLTPLKAINAHCQTCRGAIGRRESQQIVADCPRQDCVLWQYRRGKHPKLMENTAKRKAACQQNVVKARAVREENIRKALSGALETKIHVPAPSNGKNVVESILEDI